MGNSELRLRLENCMGCQCPSYIEIPLPSGFATVGRANKNGEAQSDYNFDASVSFVSRRQFSCGKRTGSLENCGSGVFQRDLSQRGADGS